MFVRSTCRNRRYIGTNSLTIPNGSPSEKYSTPATAGMNQRRFKRATCYRVVTTETGKRRSPIGVS